MSLDDTGHDRPPARYLSPSGRETIDEIRDELGDEGFVAFCRGCEIKYRARAGKKGPAETDMAKADWYRTMREHVLGLGPDPRAYRGAGPLPAPRAPARRAHEVFLLAALDGLISRASEADRRDLQQIRDALKELVCNP